MNDLLPERITSKILKTDEGHWLWQGAKTNGYGAVKYEGRDWRAHRLIWTLIVGPIPDGMDMLHKRCCIGHPECCNPDHLYVGTVQMNADDRVVCGRQHDARGELCPTHILTEAQVIQIRSMRWTHSTKQIIELFPIENEKYIWQIWGNYVWKHLPPCPPSPSDRIHPKQSTELQRFMAKVDENGPDHPRLGRCWIWSGARTFRVNGGAQMARTAGYLLIVGTTPSERRAVMKCSNEQCVNPDHIEWLTQSEICQRAESSRTRKKGDEVNTAVLNEEKVKEIFARFLSGQTKADLGRHFGVNQGQIAKVLNRECWAHVDIPENVLTQVRLLQ